MREITSRFRRDFAWAIGCLLGGMTAWGSAVGAAKGLRRLTTVAGHAASVSEPREPVPWDLELRSILSLGLLAR